MFIPMSKSEAKKLGWNRFDVIIVSGDAYIDSYYIGAAIIGKYLISKGYKVGIISQPSLDSEKDITALDEPNLFWAITSGSFDSMVANYTPLLKKRKSDDMTPGGINNKRPDRGVIVYTNLVKKYFKNTVPIVIGGIEASLRRVAHYDYWSDKVRNSILFDSKADYLIYGMGELPVLELAENIKDKERIKKIRGLCYIDNNYPENYLSLFSFEEVSTDKAKFAKAFRIFYENNDYYTAKGLYQRFQNRYLIHNPPSRPLTQEEIDYIYEMGFENQPHPFYIDKGKIKALDTINNSITSHRGCYGECSFCAIALHQGTTVISRSENSIYREVINLTKKNNFKGYINDIGGPTANMYGIECEKKLKYGKCKDRMCLYPEICPNLKVNHNKQLKLLERLRNINGIKKIFINSGIRHDMILNDKINGIKYLETISKYHISGQLKIAPEHTVDHILAIMHKPSSDCLLKFINKFYEINRNNNQFLTYYFIAAHPGTTEKDMITLKKFIEKYIKITPEQIQIFTPTPLTLSTCIYYTGIDPFTDEKIFSEKSLKNKLKQKEIILNK